MMRVQLYRCVICSTLIILLVSGCGGASTIQPQAGATFSGPMQINSGMGSNVSADGGEIEFTVTEDGAAIDSITYDLINAICTNDTKNAQREGGMSSTVRSVPPPPINNGTFEYITDEIQIKGTFDTATEASGTIKLSSEVESLADNNDFPCDFGTWSWSAVVK